MLYQIHGSDNNVHKIPLTTGLLILPLIFLGKTVKGKIMAVFFNESRDKVDQICHSHELIEFSGI